jgi:hypothetical protein
VKDVEQFQAVFEAIRLLLAASETDKQDRDVQGWTNAAGAGRSGAVRVESLDGKPGTSPVFYPM